MFNAILVIIMGRSVEEEAQETCGKEILMPSERSLRTLKSRGLICPVLGSPNISRGCAAKLYWEIWSGVYTAPDTAIPRSFLETIGEIPVFY